MIGKTYLKNLQTAIKADRKLWQKTEVDMEFLSELLSSTIQYVFMIGVAVGCFCLGGALSKNKKKKTK